MKPLVQLLKKGDRFTVRSRFLRFFWAYYAEHPFAPCALFWPNFRAWTNRNNAEKTFKGVLEIAMIDWKFSTAKKEVFREA